MATEIFDAHSSDFRCRVQYSRREDGQWFKRMQKIRFTHFSWSRWVKCSKPEDTFSSPYSGKARLPKA